MANIIMAARWEPQNQTWHLCVSVFVVCCFWVDSLFVVVVVVVVVCCLFVAFFCNVCFIFFFFWRVMGLSLIAQCPMEKCN